MLEGEGTAMEAICCLKVTNWDLLGSRQCHLDLLSGHVNHG